MHETRKNTILLVEDEENLAAGLEYNLTEEGYQVVRAEDGRIALDCIRNQSFDLIILDIMLPFHDGFELTKIIREQSPQMPILILTARTAVGDRIKGLELGADDYLTKPFHLEELLLRVKGMLKRRHWYQDFSETDSLFTFGNNEIDFKTLTCKTAEDEIHLTPHEAMVLKYLIRHKGQIVTRQELLENVWNLSSDIETRTVDIFIARLRKYIEPDPANPVYIKSIRGAGYRFFAE